MDDRIKIGDRICMDFYTLRDMCKVVGTVRRIDGSYYYPQIHHDGVLIECERYEHEMVKITEEEYFLELL